jgi:dihydrofolate reductase
MRPEDRDPSGSVTRTPRTSIIVAYDRNMLIGDGDKIPWHLPEDMAGFKRRTEGHAVIMGRKTYMSIPAKYRPLSKRFNIVLSEAYGYPDLAPEGGMAIATDMRKALFLAKAFNHACCRMETWIAGGAKVYADALRDNLVDRIVATEIKGAHNGDAYFPDINKTLWESEVIQETEQYNIVEYLRKGSRCLEGSSLR